MTIISSFLADVPSPTPLTMSDGLGIWLKFFLLTLAIEFPIVVALWRTRYRTTSLQRWMIAALVGNAITHPLASFTWGSLSPDSTAGLVAFYIVLEIGVALVETVVLRVIARCSWTAALLVAFVANAVTAGIGALLEFVF